MRVLIYQQFHPGHHYQYLRYLLPALIETGNDVVVTLTEEGRASLEFSHFLEEFSGRVAFDSSLPPWRDRIIKNQRWRLHTDVRNAVRRTEPDYVLVPSGDPHTTAMGAFRLSGFGPLPGHRPCEIGIHHGGGSGAVDSKERRKDRILELKLAASGWTRVHLVNLLFYEQVQRHGGRLARTSRLLPHPVMRPARAKKAESRRLLNLPEDGRMIGVAGAIDYRKAVPEMLAAFRRAANNTSDRLVLAGVLQPSYRETIERGFKDMVDAGRLILFDRFLDRETYQTILSALDVVCIPYPRFSAVSSVLLESLAAGRPVLANNQGWSEAIVARFGVGRTCDVLNPDAFAAAIRASLDDFESYEESEAVSRLLAFHSPENFAASLLQGIRDYAAASGYTGPRPWSWVVEPLADQPPREFGGEVKK